MINYRKEIDGLRAIAVMSVIFFHAEFSGFSGGYVGVDIFFVISGYLITSLILQDLSHNTFSLLKFYERRARRILPALLTVMVCCLPAAYVWLPPEALNDFASSGLYVLFFASNYIFYRQSGYFDPAAEFKPLLHTWSLSVEEQFYVFFPLLLFLLFRYARTKVFPTLITLFILSILTAQLAGNFSNNSAQWSWANPPDWAFFLLPTRMWELLIGVAVAFTPQKIITKSSPLNIFAEAMPILGLALIAFAVLSFDGSTVVPGVAILVPTIGTAIILHFATSETLVAKCLSFKPIVTMGLLSYSLYLWHQPLFVFARFANHAEPTPILAVLLIILAFCLAALTWKFIEQPFRQKNQTSLRGLLQFTVGMSSLVLIFYLGAIRYSGFALQRLSGPQIEVYKTVEKSNKRDECHAGDNKFIAAKDACAYFNEKPDMAVFGNSHAVELALALAEKQNETGSGIYHFTFAGCSPAAYEEISRSSPCAIWTKETVDYIAENAEIKSVVVSYRVTDKLAEANTEKQLRIWQAYIAILKRFVATGKKTTLVLQAPLLDADIRDLIFNAPNPTNVIGTKRSRWDQLSNFVTNHKDEIPPEVMVIDPTNHFCDQSACWAVKNGKALYFDEDHMSLHGASLLAKQMKN